MFIGGRGKLGYVNGRISGPETNDSKYDKRGPENWMVMYLL